MAKKKINLSLICIYNDLYQLNEYLKKAYQQQDVECELIFIDNTSNEFRCAVDAINYGIKKSTKDNVIIMHQDIVFLKNNTLKKLFNKIIQNDNSIIGVAGTTYDPYECYSSIYHGKDKKHPFPITVIDQIEVFNLDECLIGFNKKILNNVSFDNKVCDNWHMYVVDLCYQAFLKNIKVFCVNTDIWHVSSGKRTNSFYETLIKMQEKYKNQFEYISSCCIRIKTTDSVKWYKFKTNLIDPRIKNIYYRYSWSIKKRLKKLFRVGG